jgi:hypothetical protein
MKDMADMLFGEEAVVLVVLVEVGIEALVRQAHLKKASLAPELTTPSF